MEKKTGETTFLSSNKIMLFVSPVYFLDAADMIIFAQWMNKTINVRRTIKNS